MLAAALVLILASAGIGRGFAAASGTTATGFGVPGVAATICHASKDGSPTPADPTNHECCGVCALLAPVTLADAPSVAGPASVTRYVEHVQAMPWVPMVARARTPRQSQGPPDRVT